MYINREAYRNGDEVQDLLNEQTAEDHVVNQAQHLGGGQRGFIGTDDRHATESCKKST